MNRTWQYYSIAFIVTILFFSWGKNRNTPLQSKESTDSSYSGDGGSYDSYDDGGVSSDGGGSSD